MRAKQKPKNRINRERRLFRLNKRAGTVSGMLIIQIASVLFAAVIIYALSQQVSMTGRVVETVQDETLDIARNSVLYHDIYAFSLDNNASDAEGIVMTVSSLPGSAPINLEESVIYIQIGNRTARLEYRNGTIVKDLENGFYTG